MTSNRWGNVTKIVVTTILVLILIALLITFRVMIAPTIVAFLLSFILGYPVNWIQQRTGWARGATVAIIYLSILLLVAITPAFFYSRLAEIATSLQTSFDELITTLQNPSAAPVLHWGPFDLPLETMLEDVGGLLANFLSAVSTTNPFTIARGVTTSILTIIYVLVLNFWILKDFYKLQRFIFEQIPTSYQEDVRRLSQQLGNVWHSFLRGQIVLGLVVGSITWVALTIAGMPNAGALAILAGFMEFLPTVGPGFSATVGVVLSFFSQSMWLPLEGFSFFLLILTIYCIIAQFETIHLIPRLVGGRVKLHPAVTFIGIISGAIVFGLLGVLLATPVLGSTRVLLSYIYHKLLDQEPFDLAPAPLSTVRIRGLIAGRKIEAIIFDLDGTLAELDRTFISGTSNRFRWLERILSAEQRESMAQSLMLALEGPTHFVISQLRRTESFRTLDNLRVPLNSIRGYAQPKDMHPFADISDILIELAANYRLAIISTRRRTTVEKFMANAELDPDLFQTIITQEDVRNLLPHSEGLRAAADVLALEPNVVLVVSDTDVNLRSGRAADMATAGALWGLGRRTDLSDADLLLEYPTELCEWL